MNTKEAKTVLHMFDPSQTFGKGYRGSTGFAESKSWDKTSRDAKRPWMKGWPKGRPWVSAKRRSKQNSRDRIRVQHALETGQEI